MRLLLALTLLVGTSVAAQDASLAIAHATVVDTETGERLPDRTVLVDGERIVAVGPSAEIAVTGTPLAEIGRLRDDVAAGRAVGPRIVAAGTLVDGAPPIFGGYPAVETEAEARAVVDSLAEGGADFIKVYTRLPRDLFLAILDQARRRGLCVAGHVPLAVTTAEASDAGLWSVEHAYRHLSSRRRGRGRVAW